jgi:DNA primase
MSNSFDAIKFVRDHNIPTADHESKHYHENWVNVECPFCTGNPGEHLGYNTDKGYWNCYRCGYHNVVTVIEKLLNVTKDEARRIAKTYGARPQLKEKTNEHSSRPGVVKLPYGTDRMLEPHRYYLEKRGYDPNELEELWGLKGTGILGPYKFRIIAPIYHNEKLVSYQGRDITDKSPLKYKACRAEEEVMPHKETLYGIDKAKGHSVVVVEGITDVWRLGPGAVATFGIEWTPEQALLLKEYLRVFIMYDFGEDQAQINASKLGAVLSGFGVDTEKLMVQDFQGDPADLSDKKAKKLMKQILGGL